MRGSEFASRFANVAPDVREASAYNLIIAGGYREPVWKEIYVRSGTNTISFFVMSDYFQIGEEDDFLRLPMTPLLAQRIADHFGWRLPTKRVVDLVWSQAELKLEPEPWRDLSTMAELATFAKYDARTNERLAAADPDWKTKLSVGYKKDIVLANHLTAGHVAIYGLEHLSGIPIQGLNLTSHSAAYMDYSHGARFMQEDMIANGQTMMVDELLVSPALASLLSDEGVMTVLRQPGTTNKEDPVEEEEVLKVGDKGSNVADWQEFLNGKNFVDSHGAKLVVDGSFGPNTAFATSAFQVSVGLPATGIVDALTLSKASALSPTPLPSPPPVPDVPTVTPGYPFEQARNYTKANRTAIDLIVIHDMEYPERPGGAKWCADFFAGPNAPKASAHYAVDTSQVWQCVRDEDVAWHAPGANNNGIGVEHVGYAAQSRETWLDAYSKSELETSAKLTASLCRKWSIPIVKLSVDDLRAKKSGFCGHVDVTNALNDGKGHQDPGPNFPWPEYIAMVQAAYDAG